MPETDNVVRLYPVSETDVVAAPLKGGPGGGTLPPMAEDPLKARVDFLHTAYIALVAAILVVAIGLATLIFNQASGTNTRVDKLAETSSSLNREAGVLSTKLDETNRRLDGIDKKLDTITDRLPAKR